MGSNMRARWIVLAALASLVSPIARADHPMVLGPRQFEHDTSGAGAVLCAWSIFLALRDTSDACGWPREPFDDALDRGIASIDDFILANSSLRPSRQALDAFKAKAARSTRDTIARPDREQICLSKAEELQPFRQTTPQALGESVKALLASPREPVMNPCL